MNTDKSNELLNKSLFTARLWKLLLIVVISIGDIIGIINCIIHLSNKARYYEDSKKLLIILAYLVGIAVWTLWWYIIEEYFYYLLVNIAYNRHSTFINSQENNNINKEILSIMQNTNTKEEIN